MAWLPDGEKNFKDIFVRFGATHEHVRQTDRRTDTACRHIPRLCIASRGKNRRVFATVMLKCKGSSFFDLQCIFDIFIVKQICNVFICLNVQNVCQLQQVLIWHCQLLLQGLFDVR